AGVRYLITNGRDPNMQIVAQSAPAAASPVPVTAPRDMTVGCAAGPFDAVAVTLSTYGTPQPGKVSVAVFAADGAPLLQTETIDSATLVDNADQRFALPSPVCTPPSPHVVLRLQYEPAKPGAMIAAWTYPGVAFLYKALR